MASPTVTLLHLLLAVSAASAWYSNYYRFLGGSLTFTPKGRNSDGTYKVELRNKQTSSRCNVNPYLCFYGHCGTPTQTTSTVVSRNSYRTAWCQYQTVTKLKLNGNLPFGIRYPTHINRRNGQGFWASTYSSATPWRMMAHVDLGTRSDTGESNRSPITTMHPLLRVTRNCPRSFNLTVFDPEGDRVRCRIPTSSSTFECGQCNTVGGFTLDQNSCSLKYKYNNRYGYQPIELVVEDFPNKPITLSYSDGSYTAKRPFSVRRHKRQIAFPPITTTTAALTTTTTAALTTTTTAALTTTTTAAPTTTTTAAPTTTTTAALTTTTSTAPTTTTSTAPTTTTSTAPTTTTSTAPTTTTSTAPTTTTTAAPTTTTTAALTTTTSTAPTTTTSTAPTTTTSTAPTTTTSTAPTTTTSTAPTTTTSTAPTTTTSTAPTTTTSTAPTTTTSTAPTTTTSTAPTTTTSTAPTTTTSTAPTTTTSTAPTTTTSTAPTTTTSTAPTTTTSTAPTTTTSTAPTTTTSTAPTTTTSTAPTTTTSTAPTTTTSTAPTTTTSTAPTTTTSTAPTTTTSTAPTTTTSTAPTTTTSTAPTTTTSTAPTTTTTAAPTGTATSPYRSTIAPLSKLPLQFAVHVDAYDAPSCLDGDYFPTFLSPTPSNGVNLPAFVNHTLIIKVRSRAQYTTIVGLVVTGPKGISKHRISKEEYVIKWTPTENELNDHFPICFVSEAISGYRVFQSELRCVIADVGHYETTVTCNETTMRVEVEKTHLIRRNKDNLHLNNFRETSCNLKTHSNSTHLVAVMSLNECGTVVEEDEDHIIFKNAISSADPNQVISRHHDVEIVFSCVYPKHTNLTLGFTHKNPYAFKERGFGTFSFQFEFFESQRFRKQIDASTYPVDVDLKQRMFMQIEATTSIPNTELFVESCRATPYDNPNSRISYTIIEHGCVRDKTVEIYSSSNSQFRFGMEAFEFIGAHEQVYITCSVLLCETGVHGTRCSQGCLESNTGIRRGRREAVAESSRHSISQGPLHLVKTSDSRVPGPSLTLGLNLVFIVSVLLVSGVVIYRSRRSKAVKYQILPTSETN